MLRPYSNELERKRLAQLAYAWWPTIAGYRWLHGGDFPQWDDTTEEQKLSIVSAYLLRNHTSLDYVFAAPDLEDTDGNAVDVSNDMRKTLSNIRDSSIDDLQAMFANEFPGAFTTPATPAKDQPPTTNPQPQPEPDSE